MANNQQRRSDSDDSSSEEMEINIRKLRARNVRRPQAIFCQSIEIPENVNAHLENRKLEREVEEIECHKDVLEKVFGNYVIIKNIMSHLSWQDKLICKNVSLLWDSAIQTLQKEQLDPVDFSVRMSDDHKERGVELKQSAGFLNFPMVVFVFYNNTCDQHFTEHCKLISPKPCPSPCKHHHSILDLIYKNIAAPNAPLFGSKSVSISYLPLPATSTYENATITLLKDSQALYSGLYIPVIPGVEFLTVNMTGINDKQYVINKLTSISKEYLIKGVLVHLTDNYTLYTNQQEAVVVNCLNHLATLQPNTPFALGGCLVEDSLYCLSDIKKQIDCINHPKEFITGNQMTLGVFAVPNELPEKPSFEMFSCVIDSSEWSRDKIHKALREFAQNIPRFEYSVALKLSCSGRHQKHEIEQSYFRTLFPKTRIIGCFGNGELGVNYPLRNKKPDHDASKRPRTEIQYEKVHTYSTVFVYIGWGKLLVPVPTVDPVKVSAH